MKNEGVDFSANILHKEPYAGCVLHLSADALDFVLKGWKGLTK